MTVKTKRSRVTKAAGDRRQDIMDAAVRVFSTKGVAGAKVADITGYAGIAKGTFYLYFPTKDHVVAALREQFVEELVQHAQPFIEQMGQLDWWQLADAVAEDMVDWTIEHRDICAVIMQTHSMETQDIVAQADRHLIQVLAAGIRAGVEAGAFSTPDPEFAAAFIYNGTIFTVLHEVLYTPSFDRDRLVRVAKAQGRKLLAP